MDLRENIKLQPMRGAQIAIVLICILLTMIDGYEILVMAFVAPHLAKDWNLTQVEIGYLLSAGVFGTAVGAVLISPLADKIGRKNHILLCLSLITVGMLLSATAQSVPVLVAYRAFAGLFIGAIVSSLNIIVSEYSSDKRRGTVMGIYGVGLPLGAALGGAVTGPLIMEWGWRAPFIFGALLSLIMIVVVMYYLPESIEYLVEKQPKNALKQYNKIAKLLNLSEVQELPRPMVKKSLQKTGSLLFGGIMLKRTALLWLGYSGVIAAFYFANTWTAKLVSDVTGNPAMGIKTGVFILIGGVLGALLFALLSLRLQPRRVTAIILFAGTLSYLAYASQVQSGDINLALGLALLVGLCANGGVAAFYAISPPVYPAAVRGTGVGWMIGFGRGVAILAPIFTGYVLKAGWTPHNVYQLFAGVLALAGLAVWLFDMTYRHHPEDPEEVALTVLKE